MHPRLAQFGHIVIPTYSVVAAAGLIAALLLAEWCAPRVGIARERMWTLCLVVLIAVIVLSRVLLAMQMPAVFRTYPRLVLSLPTLTGWGPAIVTVCAAAGISAMRLPWLRTLDAAAPAALLLLCALHVGSFFAGTDLGSRTTLALGNLVPGDEGHHPVALYAAVLSSLICVASLVVLFRQKVAGRTFGVALIGAANSRFFVDELRPGYTLPSLALPSSLRADQVLFIALTAAGLWLLLREGGVRVTHAK